MSQARPVLLLATGNPGKVRELKALLADLPLTLTTPAGLGIQVEAAEIGASYAENARIKAVAHARASGTWALADDSGLEVDALAGGPGLRSARLAGEAADDRGRRRRLLALLAAYPRPWLARFRCIVALADPQGQVEFAEGTCEGEILTVERGEGGFGYDPIFRLAGGGKTMAELTPQEKNRLSHRAKAVQALTPMLAMRLGIRPAP